MNKLLITALLTSTLIISGCTPTNVEFSEPINSEDTVSIEIDESTDKTNTEADNEVQDEFNDSNLIIESGPINIIPNGPIAITGLDKNAEMITITNMSDENVNIGGWKIVSVHGNQWFIFSSDLILPSGDSIKVGGYSAKEQCDLIWEVGNGIWSNSKSDPAELYDAEGNLINRVDN